MKSEAGIITADFLFAIAIAMGMFTLLFAMSFSLTVVEITQYVAFATARSASLANLDADDQRAAAITKFKNMVEDKKSPLFPLYHNGWFTLSKPEELDVRQGTGVPGGKNFSQELAGGSDSKHLFMGVSIKFVAHLLHLKLPLIGQIGDENGFSTFVNAILIREPTMRECLKFYEDRRSELKNLASGSAFYNPVNYMRMEDNGC